MITTRNIKAETAKQVGRLKQVITKDIDASIPRVENPKPTDGSAISTHGIADAGDIMEKKRRDEIMVEKTTPQIEARTEEVMQRFWMRYAIVEIDELLQGISRRELK